MATVTFKDASRIYPKATRKAVDRLSLEVGDGEFVVLVGPSGCGKTTSLRMLAGLEAVDEGEILIDDRNVVNLPPRSRDIAMVFQNYALYPHMNVAENMGFALKIAKLKKSEIKARVQEAAKMLDLEDYLQRKPGQLSGGQRQRVAIARSLVLEPTLLLLDEPLGALDLKLREHMKIELKQLQAEFATTFVYITHDQSEALVLSDCVGVMNQGRFEQLGTPQDLYYRPATPFVAAFVGDNNRIVGRAAEVDGAMVQIATEDGWVIRARRHAAVAAGDAVEAFIRPEAATLGREAGQLPPGQPVHEGLVESLLFDGANSAVLLRETRSRREFRIALPQTGQFADLRPAEKVVFSFDPERATCFAARAGAAGRP